MEKQIVTIDNKEYIIAKEINNYALLINENNKDDILLMKSENDVLKNLNSEEEFDIAIKLFAI